MIVLFQGARILRFQPLIFQVFFFGDFGNNQSINQLHIVKLRLFNRDNFAMTGTASAIALAAYFSMNVLFTGVQVGMCFLVLKIKVVFLARIKTWEAFGGSCSFLWVGHWTN